MMRGGALLTTIILLMGCAGGVQQSESAAQLTRPSFDPFADDRTWDGGVDGHMTIRGDVIDFKGECGRLTLRRVSSAPLLLNEPGLAYRTRIEAYDSDVAEERCQAKVGDEVALVTQSIELPAEFATPPGIIVSVRPLAGNHVLPWWLAAIPIRANGL